MILINFIIKSRKFNLHPPKNFRLREEEAPKCNPLEKENKENSSSIRRAAPIPHPVQGIVTKGIVAVPIRKEQLSKSQTDLPWKKASRRLKGRISEKGERGVEQPSRGRKTCTCCCRDGWKYGSGISNRLVVSQRTWRLIPSYPNQPIKTGDDGAESLFRSPLCLIYSGIFVGGIFFKE